MKKFVCGVIATIGLTAVFSVVSVAFAAGTAKDQSDLIVYSDFEMTNEVEHVIVDYEVNVNGLTYGSGADATYIEDYPDLIAVVGVHGKEGYVYTVELMEAPSSPEEAVKITESIENGTYTPKVYNVYESDGKTIIDTFTEVIG